MIVNYLPLTDSTDYIIEDRDAEINLSKEVNRMSPTEFAQDL